MMANKSGWKNQQSKHQRRNHHLREIILAILVVLSVAATVCSYSAQAATPKVLVSNYKVSAKTIYSGDSFDLTLEILNTSKNKVKNMKVNCCFRRRRDYSGFWNRKCLCGRDCWK